MSATPPYIRSLTPEILTFCLPFKRSSLIDFGLRMTAIKMNNGDVFVYSPTKLDAPTRTALDAFGKVKYLIAPNFEHYLFLKDYKAAYPDAKVVGVKGLREKCPGMEFEGVLGEDESKGKVYGFENEVCCDFTGGVWFGIVKTHPISISLSTDIVADQSMVTQSTFTNLPNLS